MKQHCLIIDDNVIPSLILRDFLESMPSVEVVHIASTQADAMDALRNLPVSIVFVRMGLWNVKLFENFRKQPVIVFLSAKTDHYLDEVHGQLDFHLAEPFTTHSVGKLMDRVLEWKGESRIDFFFVRTGRRWRKVPFASVDLFEKQENGCVMLYTTPSKYLLYGSLKHWLEQLPPDKFIRPADQIIVPAYIARNITGKEFLYKGRTIPLTFKFAEKARKEQTLLEKKMTVGQHKWQG